MFLNPERFLSGRQHRNMHDLLWEPLFELGNELFLMVEYLDEDR